MHSFIPTEGKVEAFCPPHYIVTKGRQQSDRSMSARMAYKKHSKDQQNNFISDQAFEVS